MSTRRFYVRSSVGYFSSLSLFPSFGLDYFTSLSGYCDLKIYYLEYKYAQTRMIWIAGCLNGGGQIKPNPGQSAKDLIQQLETIYMQNVRAYP